MVKWVSGIPCRCPVTRSAASKLAMRKKFAIALLPDSDSHSSEELAFRRDRQDFQYTKDTGASFPRASAGVV